MTEAVWDEVRYPERPSPRSRTWPLWLALAAVLVGIALVVVFAAVAYGGGIDLRLAAGAWLCGLWYWLQLSLGCLGVYLVYQCTGGRWGETLGPYLRAGFSLLPLPALAFLPLVFLIDPLFPWARPGEIGSAAVRAKLLYLNWPFQVVRLALCLAILLLVALAAGAWRRTRSIRPRQGLGAVGLILWAVTITVLAIDWMMALEPRFYSSTIGFASGSSQLLGALALATLSVCVAGGVPSAPDRMRDLAALMASTSLLWIYVEYTQLLIVWSGNLPPEIVWYVKRSSLGGIWVSVLTVLASFVLPFAAILAPGVRRRRGWLGLAAFVVLCGQTLQAYWWIMPSVSGQVAWPPALLALWAFAGIGGFWIAGYLWIVWRAAPAPEEVQWASASSSRAT